MIDIAWENICHDGFMKTTVHTRVDLQSSSYPWCRLVCGVCVRVSEVPAKSVPLIQKNSLSLLFSILKIKEFLVHLSRTSGPFWPFLWSLIFSFHLQLSSLHLLHLVKLEHSQVGWFVGGAAKQWLGKKMNAI